MLRVGIRECAHYVKNTPPWRLVGTVEWICAACGKEFPTA